MPRTLSKLSAREYADHHDIYLGDICYFLGEYTAHALTGEKRWSLSEPNRRIGDLKKLMDRRGTPKSPHKQAAIEKVAGAVAGLLKRGPLSRKRSVAVVPKYLSCGRAYACRDLRIMEVAQAMVRRTGVVIDQTRLPFL